MADFTPAVPMNVRSVATDLYAFSLASQYGYAGQRIYSPSQAGLRDADIMERILTDPSITADLEQLQHMVAGTAWTVQPGAKDPKSMRVGDIFTEIFDQMNVHEFRYEAAKVVVSGQEFFYPESSPLRLHAFAGVPFFDFWLPVKLVDMDRRRFKYTVSTIADAETGKAKLSQRLDYWEPTVDAGGIKINWHWAEVEDPERLIRFVWGDEETRRGFGRGLIEAIYPWWYYANRAMSEWLNAVERYGQGLMILKIEGARVGGVGKDNATVQQAYIEAFKEIKARHQVAISREDSVEVLEPSGTGYQMIRELVEFCYRNITRAILGSVRGVGAAGTEAGGSRAEGETQNDNMSARIVFHQRRIDEVITHQLIPLIWRQNIKGFADAGLGAAKLPRFITTTEEKAGRKEKIDALLALKGGGVKLKKDWFYEEAGAPQPTGEDEENGNVLEGDAPAPAPGIGGIFGKAG